jgi:toxin ParE1/3/4
MKSRFHELAVLELAEAIAYYDSRAEGLGDRLLAEVRSGVAHIEQYPEGSSAISRGVRKKVLAKFPFDLFYVVGDADILILAIAHESRLRLLAFAALRVPCCAAGVSSLRSE